jgi:hypothetical protein
MQGGRRAAQPLELSARGDGNVVKASHWFLAAAAFLLGSAFSADSAGKACVQAKGERGVGYDVDKTKIKDAYAPGGRRLLENGHRVYEIAVPPLAKRDKPITCTMSLASGQWASPSLGSIDRGPPTIENKVFSPPENPDSRLRTPRETRTPD